MAAHEIDLELRLAPPSPVPPAPSVEGSHATVEKATTTTGAVSTTVSDLVLFAASLTIAAPESEGDDAAIGKALVLPGDAASKRAKTERPTTSVTDEKIDERMSKLRILGSRSRRRREDSPHPPITTAAAAPEPAWVRAELFPLHGLRMELPPLHFVVAKFLQGSDFCSQQARLLVPSGAVDSLRAFLSAQEREACGLNDTGRRRRAKPAASAATAAHGGGRKRSRTKPSAPADGGGKKGTTKPAAPATHGSGRKKRAAKPAAATSGGDGEKKKEETAKPAAVTSGDDGEKKREEPTRYQGVPVSVYLRGGAMWELKLSKFNGTKATVINGSGYVEFMANCNLVRGDRVEIWAFRRPPNQRLCFVIAKTDG